MHYETHSRLLGLPLVHVAIGPPKDGLSGRGIAKGWIAIGDIAFGVLFAFGGLAVGSVSFGGMAAGGLVLAGLSVGVWSFGGLAFGAFAIGGGAFAIWAAEGGLAVAGEYARGGEAIARNANDPAAELFFDGHFFFRLGDLVLHRARWLWILVVTAPLIGWVRRRPQAGIEEQE